MSEDEIMNPYNAKITSEGSNGNKWTFKNLEYNQDIRPGESVQFGFQVKYGERVDIPYSYSIDSSEKNVAGDSYEITNTILSSWNGGSVGELHISNNSDSTIEDWSFTVKTEAAFINVWGASVEKVSGNIYKFTCPDYCQNIAPGQTASIGYQISGDDSGIEVLELREKTKDGVINDTVSDNSISGNSISENSISENSISENSVSGNTVSENTLAETYISLDTDGYNENAAGPIITGKVDHISGTVLYPESISSITYEVVDVMDKCVKEGELDIDGADWKAEGIGLSVGINHIVFTILFNDKSEKEEIIDITNLSIENMYAADIDLSDSDDDGMPNYFEEYFGTDLQKDDTDGDGLKDTEEMYLTGSDPLVYDSLKDGISDGDYDTDEDGLTNITEVRLGTESLYSDTDYDGLSDGYEYNTTGTDPLKYDTDEDGFSDKEELDLGLDPFKGDSDGNGIVDGEELIPQTVSNEYPEGAIRKVAVDISCKGSVIENMYISDKFDGNSIVTDVEGLIGEPVIIECFSDFDTADITFTYDDTMLGDTKEEDLCMMWYDEANHDFVLLEDSVVDTVSNTVTYTTTHFSTYLLVDKVKFNKPFEDKKVLLDLTGEKDERDYYVFVVDFTASEESVNEQLRAVKAIMEYIDSVEPYSDYKDYNYDMRQYTDSFPKYILVYGRSGGAGYTYGDIATGHYDLRFNLENFDEIIQYYRDKGIVGTNKYDADFGYAAYTGVQCSASLARTYFFMGDRYSISDTWKSKIDKEIRRRASLNSGEPIINTVTLNNYGYNCFDSYVSEKGKVYRAVNGTDAVIEDIIRDLKNSGVGKDLSGINHSSSTNGKLKFEKDAYQLVFDATASPADIEKQISVGEAIINQMNKDDLLNIYYYTSSGYKYVSAYFGDEKRDAKDAIKKCLNNNEFNEENSYTGNFPYAIGTLSLNPGYLQRDSRNAKVYSFYSGNLYDGRIVESINKDGYISGRNLNQIIGYAAQKDVIINTIAISYPSSEYMDSLIPITGGVSYSDENGLDVLIEQITTDLAAQKQAVQNIAAGDSDGDGLPDSEEVGGMLGANGKMYHTNPYVADTDGDGYSDGEEMGEKIIRDRADIDRSNVVDDEELKTWEERHGDEEERFCINYRMLSDPLDINSYCRQFGDGFIEVSEGYEPYDNNLNQRINFDRVTAVTPWDHEYPVDRNGDPVYGLNSLHDSLDYIDDYMPPELSPGGYKEICIDYSIPVEYEQFRKSYLDNAYDNWKFTCAAYNISTAVPNPEIRRNRLPGELLDRFLSNDGSTFYYDADMLMGGAYPLEKSALFKKDELVNRLKTQCIKNMNPGETKYIALSPDESSDATDIHWTGKPPISDYTAIALNPRTFIAINQADSTIYAECRCDERGVIYISYDYYILDYYDWDPSIEENLYSFNTFNYACSFLDVGKMHEDSFTEKELQ